MQLISVMCCYLLQAGTYLFDFDRLLMPINNNNRFLCPFLLCFADICFNETVGDDNGVFFIEAVIVDSQEREKIARLMALSCRVLMPLLLQNPECVAITIECGRWAGSKDSSSSSKHCGSSRLNLKLYVIYLSAFCALSLFVLAKKEKASARQQSRHTQSATYFRYRRQ